MEAPVTPLQATDSALLYIGDALAVLPELGPGSVHAVITDPPYSSGGMVRGDRVQDVHTKYVNTDSTNRALPAFLGDTRDQRSYGYWCALWLQELTRIVVPGGICALFTDWRQLPSTTDSLQAGGWVWRGIVPWHKPNGRRVQGRWANNCEYVIWGTNGPRALDTLPTALDGFIQANVTRDRVHIAQKPLSVMRELVRIVQPGEVVLDPFAGAGTTGVAALNERRRFIGIELSESIALTAADRLRAAGLQPPDHAEQGTLDLMSSPGTGEPP